MTAKKKSVPIRESHEISLEDLPINENLIIMGLKAMTFGEELAGSSATKYFCLAENGGGSSNRLLVQVFSFDESLGIQNLKKGQRFFILGKLNYYRHPKTRREYHSIYAERLYLKLSK